MKSLVFSLKISALIITGSFSFSLCQAQGTAWVKASNCDCYFQTSPNSSFTWAGSCKGSYCDGYGTIQWYDVNGNSQGKFIGNLKYGKADGYATQYYSNGAIYLQGEFVNDVFRDYSALNTFGYNVADEMVSKIFDGGINLQSKVIQVIDSNGEQTIRYRITFNGNVVQTNYYAMTLVISNISPYVSFENVNDIASFYISVKAIDEVDNYLKTHPNQ
ncbi:MAG: hypothetical protein JWQ66_158 [Mucilaginibacter sp.]|nr:hypothetical protein [Mucilaginibacter sp.]